MYHFNIPVERVTIKSIQLFGLAFKIVLPGEKVFIHTWPKAGLIEDTTQEKYTTALLCTFVDQIQYGNSYFPVYQAISSPAAMLTKNFKL